MGLIRFLLAISVVISHSEPLLGTNLVGGRVAVQAFYIISGFYMTLILNEKYIKKNGSFRLFISNRSLRLYPVYWVIFILTLVYLGFDYQNTENMGHNSLRYYSEYQDQTSLLSLLFLVVTNVFMVFQDLVMFLGLDPDSGQLFFTSNFRETDPQLHNFILVPQAWTIGIEILFYLIAPLIVRRPIKVVLMLIGLSLGLRIALFYFGFSHDPWSYRFFPTELLFFLLGTIAYHVYLWLKEKEIKKSYQYFFYFFVLVYTVLFERISFPFYIYTYLFFFFCCLPFIFILSKSWKIDRYIGELSYPIYISHILVITFLENEYFSTHDYSVWLVMIATVLFSVLLNEFVAKPVETYRQGRLK